MRIQLGFAEWIFLLLAVVTAMVFAGLAWNFYRTFVSADSKAEIVVNSRTLRRENAQVISKQTRERQRYIEFTYTDGKRSYNGVLPVSEQEFDRTRVGDRVPIFYDIDQPEHWTLPSYKDWGFSATAGTYIFSMLLALAFAIVFFYLFYRSMRTPLPE
jgi:lipopolysaccharide export LptBFGC system permease protein LptF